MRYAGGALYTTPGLVTEPLSGHARRGGCVGRLHGLCGGVDDPDGKVWQ